MARRLVSESWTVFAMTRSESRGQKLRYEGISPIIGDWTDRRSLVKIPTAARVLVAVGYDPSGGRTRHEVYVEGLRNALGVIDPASDLVYVSSTGVFHQSGGVWVDEASPCRPDKEGGRAHLEAENLLFRQRSERGGGSTSVLRMAGLYGPGRVPRVDSIRRGEPISAEGEAFLNLIHIDDASSCVLAAWEHRSPQRYYLIADGNPVLRREYFEEIRKIVGGPEVRYTGQPGPRSDSNKRIWTGRMRRDLLARPLYPSYREGLRAILDGD